MGRAPPRHVAVDGVAKQFIALGERVAREGRPVEFLQFDPHVPRGGSGEVEPQPVSRDGARAGEQFSPRAGRPQRDEPIQPERVAPQQGRPLGPVAFDRVEREFPGTARQAVWRGDQPPRQKLLSVVPGSGTFGTRAEERFVPALKPHAIPAGHQQRFGEGPAIAFAALGPPLAMLGLGQLAERGTPPLQTLGGHRGTGFVSGGIGVTPLDVPRGKTKLQVRGPEVRFDLAGVELLGRRIEVLEIVLVTPREEVGRDCRADGAVALWIPPLGVAVPIPREVPPVGAVAARLGVPEGEVLRIERPLGEHRLGRQRSPSQSVGRLVGDQGPAGVPLGPLHRNERLVAGGGRGGGIVVAEDRRFARLRPPAPHQFRNQHNVVGPAPLVLMQTQFRLDPVQAVVAFGIAAEQPVAPGVHAALGHLEMARGVIQPVLPPLEEQAVIDAATPLPGGVVVEHDFPGGGGMEAEFGPPREAFDQGWLDEQFATRPDRQGRLGHPGARQEQVRQDSAERPAGNERQPQRGGFEVRQHGPARG